MCHNNWHLINKWPAKVALLVNANDGPGRMSPEKNVRKIKREKSLFEYSGKFASVRVLTLSVFMLV